MIKLVEVGPRDGLQNEKTIIPTKVKALFIERLIKAGLQRIEATSFVSPKAIPQMADSQELYQLLRDRGLDLKANFSCLVPNLKGFETASSLGVREIALFTANSETFNQKNINASIDESLLRLEAVAKKANKEKMRIRGYLSTVFGCPYEGKVPFKKTLDLVSRLFRMGCYEVSLGDTIGVANPIQVKSIIQELKKEFDISKIAMHFHDTRGLALTNIYASLQEGVEVFDASAGGLGGCPYARGATGNVATEDVWYLLDSLGLETGLNIESLIKASDTILDYLKKDSPSRYYNTYKKGCGNEKI